MTEFEKKREYAQHIADALPYLDEEQTRSYAIAITGAAATNQMVEQMRTGEQSRIFMPISATTLR